MDHNVTEEFNRVVDAAYDDYEHMEGLDTSSSNPLIAPPMPSAAVPSVPEPAKPAASVSIVDTVMQRAKGLLAGFMANGKCGVYAAVAFVILSMDGVKDLVSSILSRIGIPSDGIINMVARGLVCGLIVIALQHYVKA